MAGNIVCVVDEVRRLYWLLAETQVRNGGSSRFLTVIREIRLHVEGRVFTDDLDCCLIGTNCTITAQAPKLAADCSFWSGLYDILLRQRSIGHIIDNADSKPIFGLLRL